MLTTSHLFLPTATLYVSIFLFFVLSPAYTVRMLASNGRSSQKISAGLVQGWCRVSVGLEQGWCRV